MSIYTFLLASPFWQVGVGDPNQFNEYLVLGYVVMWLIGLAYIVSLVVRQRNLEQDVQLMEQILQEDEENLS